MKKTTTKNDQELNLYLSQNKLDGDFEWNEQVHYIRGNNIDGRRLDVKIKDITDLIFNGNLLKMLGQQLLDISEGRMHSSSKVSAAQTAVWSANREAQWRFNKKEAKLAAYKKELKNKFKS